MPRRPADEAPPPDVEMTPFIDIVFQLLVFLMVANDLSRREIEELDLPSAPHAAEDPDAPSGRLVVNLLPGPSSAPPLARVRGSLLDGEGLLRVLREHAATHPAREGPGAPSVLLRADRLTPWRHVQAVLLACGARNVEIRHIDFATDGLVPSQEGR